MQKALIDIKELSELLSIKPKTLYSWVREGKIPFVKINGLLRFRLNKIMAWLESKEITPEPQKRGYLA